MKVDADLEIDSRSALPAHSQVLSTLQTTSASCIDWKSGPRADNFCQIGLEIPIMNVHPVPLKARSPEKLVDVIVFTRMILCPAA